MEDYTPDFSVAVQRVKGFCPAGGVYANGNISELMRCRCTRNAKVGPVGSGVVRPELIGDWSWKERDERRTRAD